jgi:hypothetical protein
MSRILLLFVLALAVPVGGCRTLEAPAPAVPVETPQVVEAPALPEITAVTLDRGPVPRYDSVEMTVALNASYTNPYDARQVRLDGTFSGPGGQEMTVPGFWDGEAAWRLRFTPAHEGAWHYRLVITDERGSSIPVTGTFQVSPSGRNGWLQVGSQVDAGYSGRYLVYHDGTPFYGVGHCDALNILGDGFDVARGVGLFNKMKEAGENYVVWWPLYTNSPIDNSYDQYSVSNGALIDLVVRDAQEKGVFLIFTIWDHPQLRDENHSWGAGNWRRNGFSKLGDLNFFFTSEEAWSWQENFYRYIIARWGYSPAIGMWQTVSEIDGTNAFENGDAWHARVNGYFVEHDPYRRPTTASMAGDRDWPAGHAAMDAPQVHVYDLANDAVRTAAVIAHWTEVMWQRAEKPNWIGEFGVGGNLYYPELLHNAVWAALASGAAMTPCEWNSSGFWGRMTPEMYATMGRLAHFVADLPLAAWNPSALLIESDKPQVRAWGVAGREGGLFWVQDFSLEGRPIEEVKANTAILEGIEVAIEGMAEGRYSVTPYDTWGGDYLASFELTCAAEEPCRVTLPAFTADMAFKIRAKE